MFLELIVKSSRGLLLFKYCKSRKLLDEVLRKHLFCCVKERVCVCVCVCVCVLGAFAQTDECCRDHDHCKHTITSFSSDYGVFNTNIFTLSHCDCDNRYAST